MAQTAVSWLQECLLNTLTHEQQMQVEGLFQQAKEMEKAQIITAMIYTFNQENTLPYGMEYLLKRDEMLEDCENYYNKTYTNGL